MNDTTIDSKLHMSISQLKGHKLSAFNLACEMMMLDFGKYVFHCQSMTRIIKDNDILFTTLDYLKWDGNDYANNDEWLFKDKYIDEIIGGCVVTAEISPLNDVKIHLDNGVSIEIYVENGYSHYDEDPEQWRLIVKDNNQNSLYHIVVNGKETYIA